MAEPRWTALAGAIMLAIGLALGLTNAPWELATALTIFGAVFLALSASVWLRRRTGA